MWWIRRSGRKGLKRGLWKWRAVNKGWLSECLWPPAPCTIEWESVYTHTCSHTCTHTRINNLCTCMHTKAQPPTCSCIHNMHVHMHTPYATETMCHS
jgi:hypothetical protein